MTDKKAPATKKPALKRSWVKAQKRRNPSAKTKARLAAEAAVYERARKAGVFV